MTIPAIQLGQGTVGYGLGLRPEESNLAARSSKGDRAVLCLEKYPLPFTTDRICAMRASLRSVGGRMRPALHELAHPCTLLGDSAAAAMVDLSAEGTAAIATQRTFILLALR